MGERVEKRSDKRDLPKQKIKRLDFRLLALWQHAQYDGHATPPRQERRLLDG